MPSAIDTHDPHWLGEQHLWVRYALTQPWYQQPLLLWGIAFRKPGSAAFAAAAERPLGDSRALWLWIVALHILAVLVSFVPCTIYAVLAGVWRGGPVAMFLFYVETCLTLAYHLLCWTALCAVALTVWQLIYRPTISWPAVGADLPVMLVLTVPAVAVRWLVHAVVSCLMLPYEALLSVPSACGYFVFIALVVRWRWAVPGRKALSFGCLAILVGGAIWTAQALWPDWYIYIQGPLLRLFHAGFAN